MTSERETVERDDEEPLGHPIDPLLVAAYRDLMPYSVARSTRAASEAGGHDTSCASAPLALDGREPGLHCLDQRYQAILSASGQRRIRGFRLGQRLGQGGQGIVFVAECRGADGFTNEHLALKLFAPHRYPTLASYEKDMRRIARMASLVAGIDQGNVLDVERFEVYRGIRVMIMKRVRGYDLRQLMNPEMLERVKHHNRSRWTEITKVVAEPGPHHVKFKPGAAVAIIRSCLEALERLHSQGIVHGDVKPENIMISPEAEVKLVDIGSAFEWKESPQPYFCTPRYAGLEVLERDECTPQSDLASVGYVLMELLTGCPVFPGQKPGGPQETSVPQEASTGIKAPVDRELANEKRDLPGRLDQLLKGHSPLLLRLCRRLIDPDPSRRFASARDAELDAYAFVQQLEQAKLACHFAHMLRLWLEACAARLSEAGTNQ